MSPQELLNELQDLGYAVYLEGTNIRYKRVDKTYVSKEKVTLRLNELKQNKLAVIEQLKSGPKPYIAPNGDLVIPFDSDPKYHWWRGGQSVTKTKKELGIIPKQKEESNASKQKTHKG